MLKPTKILVPTDFSEFSDKAFRQALDIARQYKAKVYLVHVIQSTIYQCVIDYCISEETMREVEEQAVKVARENLQKEIEKFPQAKEVEVVADVKTGVPYEEILSEEEEKGIDLIVIASLGRSGIAKYLVGSVARNVLKGAKCPVLLTK
jgi:universal stress protein A